MELPNEILLLISYHSYLNNTYLYYLNKHFNNIHTNDIKINFLKKKYNNLINLHSNKILYQNLYKHKYVMKFINYNDFEKFKFIIETNDFLNDFKINYKYIFNYCMKNKQYNFIKKLLISNLITEKIKTQIFKCYLYNTKIY